MQCPLILSAEKLKEKEIFQCADLCGLQSDSLWRV